MAKSYRNHARQTLLNMLASADQPTALKISSKPVSRHVFRFPKIILIYSRDACCCEFLKMLVQLGKSKLTCRYVVNSFCSLISGLQLIVCFFTRSRTKAKLYQLQVQLTVVSNQGLSASSWLQSVDSLTDANRLFATPTSLAPSKYLFINSLPVASRIALADMVPTTWWTTFDSTKLHTRKEIRSETWDIGGPGRDMMKWEKKVKISLSNQSVGFALLWVFGTHFIVLRRLDGQPSRSAFRYEKWKFLSGSKSCFFSGLSAEITVTGDNRDDVFVSSPARTQHTTNKSAKCRLHFPFRAPPGTKPGELW
jgi:hypothetical protein